MKFLLDNLWVPAFAVAYFFGGIYPATAALIAALFLTVALYWLIERRIHKVHLFSAIAAGILGGLTLYVRDPTFIKFKPTVVYLAFSAALLLSQVFGDRVLLARLPQKLITLPDPVWRKVNFAWALFFVFCAALNLYVAFHFDEATWVKLKLFGFSLLMFVFLLGHLPFLHKYLPQEETTGAGDA